MKTSQYCSLSYSVIFINDWDDKIEWTLSKFTHEAKLGRAG